MGRSNLYKWDKRGRGVAETYNDLRDLYKGYFSRALAGEPPNSPRRRQLLLEQAAMFPGKGRRNSKVRLRTCIACRRAYEAPANALRGHPPLRYCRGCRRLAARTPLGRHFSAIRGAAWRRNRLQRIRRALGDAPKPVPPHCQHGICTNSRSLVQTWLSPDSQPLLLCPRHRHAAVQKVFASPFTPRTPGRPAIPRRSPRPASARSGPLGFV